MLKGFLGKNHYFLLYLEKKSKGAELFAEGI